MSIKLIDIGNSSIVMADFINGDICYQDTFSTKNGIELLSEVCRKHRGTIVVSSVVPMLDKALAQYDHVSFVTHETIPLLEINVDHPSQVGADRLVNALAAFTNYSPPVLIIDSGTALTFCVVDGDAVYQGGAIFPGMGIASKALNDYTAKIPHITVSPQEVLYGKNTTQSVEIGLYYGYVHVIQGFIDRYRAEYPELTVIGTGSGIRTLEHLLNVDVIDDDLILKGLAYIANERTASAS